VRLCKARRYRYANSDMADLETQLQAAADARFRLIVTDGVFSMDGTYARLADICDLAERYDALVMVDDSHAIGFVGERGAGTPELQGVEGRVHITTGTFGKALGGASGGYITGPQAFIDLLRQRARPYLFSNSLAPSIVCATLAALELLEQSADLRRQVADSTTYFRARMVAAGFDVVEGEHAIVRATTRQRPDGTGGFCHRLFLPGGAERAGAGAHADERGAQPRADRSRDRGIYHSGTASRPDKGGRGTMKALVKAHAKPGLRYPT